MERLQVKLGSWTWPGFQVMSLVRELVERFSLGVILDLRLLSTILLNNIAIFPLSFMIFLMALLASKKRRRHSGGAYQDPVLT